MIPNGARLVSCTLFLSCFLLCSTAYSSTIKNDPFGLNLELSIGYGMQTSRNTLIDPTTNAVQAGYHSGAQGLAGGVGLSYIKLISKALLGAKLFYQHYNFDGGGLDALTANNFQLDYFKPEQGIGAEFLAGYQVNQHTVVFLFLGPELTRYQVSMTERGQATAVISKNTWGVAYGSGLLIPISERASMGFNYRVLASSLIKHTLPQFRRLGLVQFKPTLALFQFYLNYAFH